ncbi:MAG TPA: hypothetical protein PK231_06430 [Acidocella sp.]|nr:hypothetical protein [Acidocella sp.]
MRLPNSFKLVLLIVPILGFHIAYAQPVTAQSPYPILPPDCRGATLSGPKLLKIVQKIIAHGDLTDIQFIERTLRTKFKKTHGWTEDGTPDLQTSFYDSDVIYGDPIHVKISVWSAYHVLHTGGSKTIASIGFSSSNGNEDFLGNCLFVSEPKFYAFFSEDKFSTSWVPPPVGVLFPPPPPHETEEQRDIRVKQQQEAFKAPMFYPKFISRQEQGTRGKNGTSLSLYVLFPFNFYVDFIMISQTKD